TGPHRQPDQRPEFQDAAHEDCPQPLSYPPRQTHASSQRGGTPLSTSTRVDRGLRRGRRARGENGECRRRWRRRVGCPRRARADDDTEQRTERNEDIADEARGAGQYAGEHDDRDADDGKKATMTRHAAGEHCATSAARAAAPEATVARPGVREVHFTQRGVTFSRTASRRVAYERDGDTRSPATDRT